MHECPRPPAGTGRHTVRMESLPVRATTIVLGYLLQSYLIYPVLPGIGYECDSRDRLLLD
jgi:hypothetical protein